MDMFAYCFLNTCSLKLFSALDREASFGSKFHLIQRIFDGEGAENKFSLGHPYHLFQGSGNMVEKETS